MIEPLFKEKKEKQTPSEKFSKFVSRFCREQYRKTSNISDVNTRTEIVSIIYLLGNITLENSDTLKVQLDKAIDGFFKFKKTVLSKLTEAKDSIIADSKKGVSISSEQHKKFRDNFKEKKKSLELAESIVTGIENFYNSNPLLKKYSKEEKKQKYGKAITNGTLGLLSAMAGTSLPLMIPSAFKKVKEIGKDFKNADGKTKGLMALQGVLTLGGVALGGSASMFGASLVGQSVNARKQKSQDINQAINQYNKNLSRNEINDAKHGSPYSYGSLLSEGLGDKSRITNKDEMNDISSMKSYGLKKLDPALKIMLESMKGTPQYNVLKKHYLDQGYIGLEKGGSIITDGLTRILAGEGNGGKQKERVNVTPLNNDPVSKELKITNKQLKKLLKIAENHLSISEELYEDQSEANRLLSLGRKESKKEERKDFILNKKDKKDEQKDKPSIFKSLFDLLGKKGGAGAGAGGASASSGLLTQGLGALTGAGGSLLSAGVVGAGLALATAGSVLAVSLLVKKFMDDSGLNAKIEQEGKERRIKEDKGIDEARKRNTPEKVAETEKTLGKYDGFFGQIKAVFSKEYWDARKQQQDQDKATRLKTGETLDYYGEYAEGGSFTTKGAGILKVGEKGEEIVTVTPINRVLQQKYSDLPTPDKPKKGISKPSEVVVKDDQSKQTKKHLDYAQKTSQSTAKTSQVLTNVSRTDSKTTKKDTPEEPKSILSTIVDSGSKAITKGYEAAKEVVTPAYQASKEAVGKGYEASKQAVGKGYEASRQAVGGAAKAVGKGFQNVKDYIFKGADKSGVNKSTMIKFAQVESGFNANAKAGTSSATGLYQFTKSTWKGMMAKYAKQEGIDPNTPPTDPSANAIMAGHFIKDNEKALIKAGIPVTDGSLYLMHFLGRGGGVQLLKSNRDASAAKIFPKAAKANDSVFYDKGRERTVGEIIGWADRKMNIDTSKYTNENNATQQTKQATQQTKQATPATQQTKQASTATPQTKQASTATPATPQTKPIFGDAQERRQNKQKEALRKSAKNKAKVVASVPTVQNEGSVENIKQNSNASSTQSDVKKLKNTEVAIDTSTNANLAKGTQKAINNIVVGQNSPPPSPPPAYYESGDNKMWATKLARSY